MHKLRILAAAAVLALANQAQAAPPSMYASLEWLAADFFEIYNSPGWAFSLGYELNRFFAIEARAGMTGSDSVTLAAGTPAEVTIEAEIDHIVSGFVRLSLPDWPAARIHPYLLVGYTNVEASFESSGITSSDSESDVSYGIGIHFFGSKNASLKLEAVEYFDKHDTEISAYSVGFAYRF